MQILFGPAHDARHIDPDAPNGYEWWYFDAISDDGNYALVVIFFLGTPMSPYYKTVVDGKNPLPKDWCGVFVSLHERKPGKHWRERAYAYNLYRNGAFATDAPAVHVGGSTMRGEVVDGQWRWHLTLDEPGLWRGRTQAELTFTLLGEPLTLPPVAEADGVPVSDHHWVCVAPRCRVEGVVTAADGESIAFGGTGYHDHNFGTLPWHDVKSWFWARFHFVEEQETRTAIFYETNRIDKVDKQDEAVVLFFDQAGHVANGPGGNLKARRWSQNVYGFEYGIAWDWTAADESEGLVSFSRFRRQLSEGPFYIRFTSELARFDERDGVILSDLGIGEVFQPSRLCGPIASRAMWTRMRRRS